MTTGWLNWPIGQGSIEDLADANDFIGINYYSKALVRFPPTPNRLYETNPSTGAIVVDDDFFEHYPAGLFQAIEACLTNNKPIYITEHGIPDRDDKWRPLSILSHLREIWRAINFNYPIMGYYYWSLIDNFEWERGWSQRFGLIEIDQATQSRKWRPSAHLYQEICNRNAISSDMASRFAPDTVSIMFPG